MADKQQIFAFLDDTCRLEERCRDEFDMAYTSVVGVLFMKSQLLRGEAENGDVNEGS